MRDNSISSGATSDALAAMAGEADAMQIKPTSANAIAIG
jgi:hypothetical protein